MQFKDPKNNSFASLSPAVWRASTVVFDNFEDFINRKSRQPDGYSYGITGTPTSRQLETRIADLEGANHCIITPSGQSALMTATMAFIRGGDHMLISDSCYGALKTFGRKWLSQMGVEVEFYPPTIGEKIEELVRPNTRLICLESPGTVTMEMQDIDAITQVAKAHNIKTMMDNTWASPLFFKPLEHGVDLSIEAATKMFGGHSDLLMGTISLNNFDDYAVLRETQSILGQAVSPEDIFLVLRGLDTFELRLREQSKNTLKVAQWLETQPQIESVMFPALESDPGHDIWKQQYSGSGCLFSFTLEQDDDKAIAAFFNALEVFPIGASWGGTHSLIAYYPAEQQQARHYSPTTKAIIRVSIGLENVDTLIQDLNKALKAWQNAL